MSAIVKQSRLSGSNEEEKVALLSSFMHLLVISIAVFNGCSDSVLGEVTPLYINL